MKIHFYTALFGNYDDIKSIDKNLVTNKNLKFIIYTDQKSLKSNSHDVRYIKRPHRDPTIANRIIKFNPYKYCRDCDFAVYHDANIAIRKLFIEYINNNTENFLELNLFKHPINLNVNDELNTLLKIGKITVNEFKLSHNFFKKNNLSPKNLFLSENNILITKPKFLIWNNIYDELLFCLKNVVGRDQIILPAILKKNKFKFTLNHSLMVDDNSMYFNWSQHKTNLIQELIVRYKAYINKKEKLTRQIQEKFYETHIDKIFSNFTGKQNFSKLLSIVLPVYNRIEIFDEVLLDHIRICKPHSIKIFISDDSDSDLFSNKIEELRSKYDQIYYIKNTPSLLHDKNIISSLQMPKTEYVWLLGDSFHINKKNFEKILLAISNHKPDLLSVNAFGRSLSVPSDYILDSDKAIKSIGWHLTLTGATIYSRKSINKIKNINFNKIKNFPQFYLIFIFLSIKENNILWVNEKIIYSHMNKKESYWLKSAFSVFIDDWGLVLDELIEYYPKKTLKEVYISHNKNTKLFKTKNLIKLRILGIYNIDTLKKYKDVLLKDSGLPFYFLYLIARFPILKKNLIVN